MKRPVLTPEAHGANVAGMLAGAWVFSRGGWSHVLWTIAVVAALVVGWQAWRATRETP